MPNISFRFFNVYGPRLDASGQYSAVIGTFLSQIKKNKPLTIVGDGKPRNSLANISKVKKDINWKPQISIETGIKQLLKN